MIDNHLVWPTIESLIAAYKLMDADGNLVPDLESRTIARRRQIALRKYFEENGLLTVKAFDDDGSVIDRQYRKTDFTDDGFGLCKRKVPAWMKSKASAKDPPDMKLLEKALVEIRAGE
ncbi:hypothetical protein F0336_24880 [Serratia liquefaciens]|jgi:hypothetical protein|uniref:hypothetical protein n=1 Tax=Serratia liquefaciens TaxID=614 RepID=UPI0011F3A827|nr:hypothetical protein [Serratia liquefaciens]QIC89495.1 hypothetical protein F0336_24880 [Serratia liquefaciens]